MKRITLTLLLLGTVGFTTIASAQDDSSADSSTAKDQMPPEDQAATDKAAKDKKRVAPEEVGSEEDTSAKQDKPAKEGESSKQEKVTKQDKSFKENKTANDSGKSDINQAKDADERGTPPWTNDSANVNLQQSRTPPDENKAKPYSKDDFTVKPEWEKAFPETSGFSLGGDGKPAQFQLTGGEGVYQTLCQACHMPDGQGAEGAGIYPSFVGNERLRSPYYPIDVIVNGLRGMQGFGDMLSNEQIANVVDYLRTNFGNQLEADTTADDVARVRHEQ